LQACNRWVFTDLSVTCLQSSVNCSSRVCYLSLTVCHVFVHLTLHDKEYIQAPACRSLSLK